MHGQAWFWRRKDQSFKRLLRTNVGLLKRKGQDCQWNSNEHGVGNNKSHWCYEFDYQRWQKQAWIFSKSWFWWLEQRWWIVEDGQIEVSTYGILDIKSNNKAYLIVNHFF